MPSIHTTVPAQAAAVFDFWLEAGPENWFIKDVRFDQRFRERFLTLHLAAAGRELDDWRHTAQGALALLILLDQFPRNAFRGTGHMYATDQLARRFASQMIEAGLDQQLPESLQLFCYLPFSHSENLADQQRAVALNQRLGAPSIDHAIDHMRIIERFGRFPHRNPMLGRDTTPEEQHFLSQGGFAG